MISMLDLLFPKRCLGCGKWGNYVCPSCHGKMKPLQFLKCPVCEKQAIDGITHPHCRTKYGIDGLTSFFRYDGVIKRAIKQIKYRYSFDIINELIDCIPDSSFSILSTLLKTKPLNIYLVPIPLHRSRYNFRSFNQAEMIARALEKRLHIPVKTDLLLRTKKTIPQVEMKDREKRLVNMKNVFSVHNSYVINPIPNVILVDDVFTTGATLRSASSILKCAGAKVVWGVTIAQ